MRGQLSRPLEQLLLKTVGRRFAASLEANMTKSFRLSALIAASAFALVVAAPAFAVDSTTPSSPPQTQSSAPKEKGAKKKKAPKKNEKKSEQQFIDGYKAAHAMIYKRHRYAAAIDKLKSLGRDDNADVANLIGYSSRKLGRYEDSKLWYERALAADPGHTVTWSYYGMWHAEQGNLLKAKEHLVKVAELCGSTRCRAYTELKGVIEGTRAY
jgi:tetratricopeptide (TPR) repeat protein